MKPYVKILLKENIPYFIAIGVMVIGTIISVGYLYGLQKAVRQQMSDVQLEISSLTQRRFILQSLAHNNSEEITENLEIMNALIPNSEDYFSIIYALDQLSLKTGFVINSYIVDLTASKVDRLAISVSGLGDSQSFLQFLKEYNTSGGRLITAETIQLDSANNGSITLRLYFYNKVASTDKLVATQNYSKALENFEKIRSKVAVSIRDESTVSTSPDTYVPKSNPF